VVEKVADVGVVVGGVVVLIGGRGAEDRLVKGLEGSDVEEKEPV
jgi:hypothetical protein